MKKVFRLIPAGLSSCLPAVALFAAIGVMFLSCDSGGGGTPIIVNPGDDVAGIVDVSYPASSAYTPFEYPVTRVDPADPVVKLEGLAGQNVFLLKANASTLRIEEGTTGMVRSFTVNGTTYVPSTSKQTVSQSTFPQYSSRALTASRSASKRRAVSGTVGGITRLDHEAARRLSARKLPEQPSLSRSAGGSAIRHVAPSYSVIGDAKTFNVQNATGVFVEITARLRAVGDHCYIWVPEVNFNNSSVVNNDNRITNTQVKILRDKFETMYPLVTHLFGYENGGGLDASDENYGGVDGDPKISVLVYDIGADYSAKQVSGILGFFWGKDYYTQDIIDNNPTAFGTGVKTNLAEIFYLDSHFTDNAPDYIYSTLMHEYQHMINFARKSLPVVNGGQGLKVEPWFNEMLSMLSEDIIGPEIGIDPGIYPLNSRIPLFLAAYSYSGVTDWLDGEDVYASYASAYAFGAFLARNYGGAELVKKLLECTYANCEAVGYAIQALDYAGFPAMDEENSTDVSGFELAFKKYAEALIFSGKALVTNDDLASFDRSVTKTITVDANSHDYSFTGFDIWTLLNYYAGTEGLSADYHGPVVWELGGYSLRPYGLDLQSNENWQGVNGTLEIEFDLPPSDDVELYVMVR